jgi:hypothetical protein
VNSYWFVAYDAICLLEKEIKECNSLLLKRTGNTFKINKIQGAESPESISFYVKAKNWTPCSAKVHVGNIEKIIHNLGGQMLYGEGTDSLGIVIREIIQNARDSIKARETIEEDIDFNGKILIHIEKLQDSTWITIEDNGIGMSKRVLTGPLLDFGTSFWTSSLVQREFPGLRSSKFKSIGKFGIGFYSIFMIAEQVFVTSKNFREGLSDVHQLKFINGFSLRPILSQGKQQGFNSSSSTVIKIKLKPNIISEDFLIKIETNKIESTNFQVPVKDYLSTLCAGLDIPVFLKESNSKRIKIHECMTSEYFDKINWLKTISFSDNQTNSIQIKDYINKNHTRLTPVTEEGKILGMAAISTINSGNNNNFLSINTIGGLANSVHSRDGDDFIGYLDYTPKSAKRDINEFVASEETLKKWAKEQLQTLLSIELNPHEKYIAASSLCKFKVDPSELAMILVSHNNNVYFLSFNQLADLSKTIGIAFLETNIGNGGHMEINHAIPELPGYALVRPLTNSSFLSLKIKDKIPEENFSILDCLYRKIIEKGMCPKIEKIEAVGNNVWGWTLNAIIVSSFLSNLETFN